MGSFLFCSYMALGLSFSSADVTCSLDLSKRYQQILGWGATSFCPAWATEDLKREVAWVLVHEFGLTRLRLEPPGGNRSDEGRWERYNDNGDPYELNWSAMDTRAMEKRLVEFLIPFKEEVEKRGDSFNLYVSPSFFNGGSTGSVPVWLLQSPAEYTEYALSILTYLREKHGIVADYWCILNEAGNNNPFSPEVVAAMIKNLGPALRESGFPTKIQFPECVNAYQSWRYVSTLKDDDEIWQYVGLVSYHLYGKNDPYRSYLRDFSQKRGLPTAQTEYMGLKMQHLYDDLTKGGVSFWEIYGTGSQIEWGYNRFRRKSLYWKFRQVLNYVRPGAFRVEATSNDLALKILAFEKDGGATVILINEGADRKVTINNLPNGPYGVCQTVGSGPYEELGIQEVLSGSMSIFVKGGSVVTVYPHKEANLPPVPVFWESDREYLTLPADTVELRSLALDPELDQITYLWEVVEKPEGASVVIRDPHSRDTSVSGLRVPGLYRFKVSFSDSRHIQKREVRVSVFRDNQPPVPLDVHNRLPVEVTLPENSTLLRAAGWDLEGDELSYRWSILSKPQGASPVFSDPNSPKCRVSNLSVPGDYVFALELSDGKNSVSAKLTVTVHPPNKAPQILSATASPSKLILPQSSTTLSAKTRDPDGDTITHWWSLKSFPKGAKPILSTPGRSSTEAKGLSLPGTYLFTLKAIDRNAVTVKEVRVEVEPPQESFFIRGDTNADGTVDISDAIFLLSYLFQAGSSPTCMDSADSNDDGRLDISDAVQILRYLFGPLLSLPIPFPVCGKDPKPDSLGCLYFQPCT